MTIKAEFLQMQKNMSRDDESAGYAAAVAATAYAIKSQEDSIRDLMSGPQNISIRAASRTDTGNPLTPAISIKKKPTFNMNINGGTSMTKPADLEPQKSGIPASQSIRKNLSIKDLEPQKSGIPASQSIRRNLSSNDQLLNLPERESSFQPTIPKVQIPPNAVNRGNKADDWEREEMRKIKERYEKLQSSISGWKDKKKEKAEQKLKKIEDTLEAKKKKAKDNYSSEIQRIENISNKEKEQTKRKQEKEELKVKDKASKYRKTGKAPSTFWCF